MNLSHVALDDYLRKAGLWPFYRNGTPHRTVIDELIPQLSVHPPLVNFMLTLAGNPETHRALICSLLMKFIESSSDENIRVTEHFRDTENWHIHGQFAMILKRGRQNPGTIFISNIPYRIYCEDGLTLEGVTAVTFGIETRGDELETAYIWTVGDAFEAFLTKKGVEFERSPLSRVFPKKEVVRS